MGPPGLQGLGNPGPPGLQGLPGISMLCFTFLLVLKINRFEFELSIKARKGRMENLVLMAHLDEMEKMGTRDFQV